MSIVWNRADNDGIGQDLDPRATPKGCVWMSSCGIESGASILLYSPPPRGTRRQRGGTDDRNLAAGDEDQAWNCIE